MTELILQKLGSREGMSAHMLDVVHRAQNAGLHKIAATVRGMDEFTFRDAILELSTKLAYNHLKRQKIASGMRALLELEADGDIKLGGLNALTHAANPARSVGQYANSVNLKQLAGGQASKAPMSVKDLMSGAPSAVSQSNPNKMSALPAMAPAQPGKLPMGRLPGQP